MKRKGGSHDGSSAGEHKSKGLAGPHAYEVVDAAGQMISSIASRRISHDSALGQHPPRAHSLLADAEELRIFERR